MLTREIPSHVSIVVPYGLTVWEDEACTIELTELDFGNIIANGESDYVSFYLKNEGENDTYIAISQSGLDDNHLALNWEDVTGSCPPDDMIMDVTYYYANVDPIVSFALTGTMDTPAQNYIELGSACTFVVNDVIKVEDELMLITVAQGSGKYTVQRGYFGTTATAHSMSQIAYLQQLIDDQDSLIPDALMNVVLFLTANDQATTKTDVDFTVVINASDIPY
jgi:hypothetical protein